MPDLPAVKRLRRALKNLESQIELEFASTPEEYPHVWRVRFEGTLPNMQEVSVIANMARRECTAAVVSPVNAIFADAETLYTDLMRCQSVTCGPTATLDDLARCERAESAFALLRCRVEVVCDALRTLYDDGMKEESKPVRVVIPGNLMPDAMLPGVDMGEPLPRTPEIVTPVATLPADPRPPKRGPKAKHQHHQTSNTTHPESPS